MNEEIIVDKSPCTKDNLITYKKEDELINSI